MTICDINKTPAQAFTLPAHEKKHKLGICALRLRQGRIQKFSYVGQSFLVLKRGGGLDEQIWYLNRAHETERMFFK